MANIKTNVPYDQLPHVVINHPETNPNHKEIMRVLFKVLKDKDFCVFSNEKISECTRIPLRTIERCITELCKFGLLSRIGKTYNRRLSLGLLFNTSATMAETKLNTSATMAVSTAKSVETYRHTGGYNKPYTKPSFNSVHLLNTQGQPQKSRVFNMAYHEYQMKIKSGIELKLLHPDTEILELDEWLSTQKEN